MSRAIHVTDTTFEEQVIQSEKLILVDFWAEWCPPCKLIAPVLDEIASELDGQLVIGKLNVDENPDTQMAYGVMSIPTLLVFKSGEPVDRIVGFQQKPQLLKRLLPHLGELQPAGASGQ